MRVYLGIILILVICGSFVTTVLAGETLWKELTIEVVKLVQQGKYPEAVEAAKRALEVAEETFGPDHLKVAVSLNNLGLLYKIQGRYAEAESLYKRALTIWEEAYGPDDLNVATVLGNMAELYKKTGREDEAEKLGARARKIRSNLKRSHPQ